MDQIEASWKHTPIERFALGQTLGTSPAKAADPDLSPDSDLVLIPKERYTAPSFMALEWEKLWTKVWNLAGPAQWAPAPDDYFTTELGSESFLIVRQADGGYRGFYNVCLHRGNRLVAPGSVGRASSFSCSYHGWTWNADGSLNRIPDRETFRQELSCPKMGMKEIRVDVWGGMIWFCLDPQGPSLKEFLGVIPDHLDCYQFEKQTLVQSITVEWPCNWKTSVDAFNESYHVQATHPELMPWLDDFRVQIDCFGRHNRYLIPFLSPSPHYRHHDTLSDELQYALTAAGLTADDFKTRPMEARRAVQIAKRQIQDQVRYPYATLNDDQLSDDYHYMIFPNITMNIYAEALMLFRSRPHPSDPDKMLFDQFMFGHIADEDDYVLPEHKTYQNGQISLGLILDQDAANLPKVQQGMHSQAYPGLILGDQELRIRHFHKSLMDYIDPERVLGV